MSLQLHLNRNTLKVGCVNGGDSFDHEFRGTKFHKSLLDSTKLPFDYRFGAARDHFFLSVREHPDLNFEEAGENIQRVPSGGNDFILANRSRFFVQKAEDFLKGFLAGAGLDLANRFLDSGSFNLHHTHLRGRSLPPALFQPYSVSAGVKSRLALNRTD
jgi:hypothetical protein